MSTFPQMAVDGAWGKAKQAVVRVTAEVMQYDSEGIDIYFLNSSLYQDSIKVRYPIHIDCRVLTVAIYQVPEDVIQIFGKIKPKGITLSFIHYLVLQVRHYRAIPNRRSA